MREKHLAEFAGLPSSACINGKGYILQGKSLKFLAVGFLADKRNQRRADCRDLVAKLSCHAVAVAGRAGARIRGAARTEDNGTGAMYRAVTYEVLSKGIFDEIEIVLMTNKIDMEVRPDKDAMLVFVDGEDVTPFLRTADVSAHVSWVSAMAGVRRAMVKIQRKQAEKGGIVLDGRDIGTTVLPNADVKIFLTASAHTRAIRRCMELAAAGQDVTPEGIEEDIQKRDYQDSHRAVSPLRQADDAVLLDNGDLTLEETADAIISICREKFPGFDA